MWKIAVILLLAAFCVHADEEPQQQPSKNGKKYFLLMTNGELSNQRHCPTYHLAT